ncbi:hypothetical protein [Salinarimonas ramus]|uniref:Threonine/homoserine/homoserine lactone efflux protein n=1 Tax=Salinarimonas ramus TaxID=690164 RepID=A0A917Q4G7_9HYPH|nr:hypothetical protein [Salinarimonas ramus]GGK21249.1 hypothetical protein GCM10011322_04890 [Salinarimonas ramus]
MTELALLFASCFLVAIVPGPLALITFHGGTDGWRPFLTGLSGQLLGLALVGTTIIAAGSVTDILANPWFERAAALCLIALGIIIWRGKKSGRAGALSFASTFGMAATNPKAILGFGPALVLYHGTAGPVGAASLMLTIGALWAAVSAAMVIYYILGRTLRDARALVWVRRGAALILVAVGLLLLLR